MKEENFSLWSNLKQAPAYKLASKLSQLVWSVVNQWDWFAKQSFGSQYVRAADSVASNIAEGWGRFSFQDKYNFYRIARGSLLEVMNWTVQAHQRKLLPSDSLNDLQEVFKELPYQLNILMAANRKKKTPLKTQN